MTAVLQAAVANAVLAAPLALLAFGAGRFLRKPALTHALWVLVLLKLVTPPVFDVPMIPASVAPRLAVAPSLAVSRAERRDPLETGAARGDAAVSAKPQATRDTEHDAAMAVGAATTRVRTSDEVRTTSEPRRLLPLLASLAMIVWLAGAVAIAAAQLWRTVRFRRFLRSAAPAPDLDREAAALAVGMGLRRCPPVRRLPGVVSPMLWGVGRRTAILFPAELADRLGPDRRATLLAHELAHFGHGDQWVRLVELAAGTLYWWHPAVWLARRGIEDACEDCADAWVVERFRSAPRAYADALLDAVDFLAAGPTAVVPGVTGLGTADALRRRLTRIMLGTRPRTLSKLGWAAMLTLAATLPLQPALLEITGATALASATESLSPTVPISPPLHAVEDEPPVRFPEPLAPPPREHVWATASTADGRQSLVARLDGGITLRDARTGRTVRIVGSELSAADFSPDGLTLATADAAGRLLLWDTAKAKISERLRGDGAAVRSVAFSPSGEEFAAAGDDGVELWSLANLTAERLPSPGGPVTCVRFSPDGRTLAAACGAWSDPTSGRVLIWDGAAWSPVSVDAMPAAVEFVSAGSLAVAGWDGRATLYDLSADAVVGTTIVEKERVSAAAFSPAARALAGLTYAPSLPEFAPEAFWLSSGYGTADPPARNDPATLWSDVGNLMLEAMGGIR